MNTFTDQILLAKQRLSVVAVIGLLGFGDRKIGLSRCPFHDDSSPSFSVFLGDDGLERWKCHAGCGGGDAIGLLEKAKGLTNGEACHELIRLAGVAQQIPAVRTHHSTAKIDFNWAASVSAFGLEQKQELAKWRRYNSKFVDWLHENSLVGCFNGEIAFPVTDAKNAVVGCHYRFTDGWRYHPKGIQVAPLIIGDIAKAETIYAFESQWDAFAVLDVFQWHSEPVAGVAIIATRGAGNGRMVAGICPATAVVYAFTQNDGAGRKWAIDVAAHCGCVAMNIAIPPEFKDVNDWTRSGAGGVEIRQAISESQPVAFPRSSTPAPVANSHHSPSYDFPEENDIDPETFPFPLDALPPVMALFTAGIARCERVPTALPAVCALGVASAAIGAGLEVESGANRVTRGNLFLLASAESGSGKSETFRLVALPLLDHQARRYEIWRLKTKPKNESEIGVLDKEAVDLEKKAAKSVDPHQRERLLGELEYKVATKNDLARRSAAPCIIAQDVTTERLAVLLHENRETIFSTSGDARKVIDNLMGRYSSTKSTDESLY